jgi:hypothetical protein
MDAQVLATDLVDLRCPNLHVCVISRPEPDIKAILNSRLVLRLFTARMGK